MAPIVALFPGQGSQKMGMAQDFHDAFDAAEQVFQEASETLGFDMGKLCFEEDPRLHQTAFTQPAILTSEIAILQALRSEMGLEIDYYGGHSLGEYTALVAAGVIPFGEALHLVQLRGQRMQEAVPAGQGAMAALIRDHLIPEAIQEVLKGLVVDLANLNSPNQIVISGAASDVEQALERLQESEAGKGARARMLKVSAPFHSRLMTPIEPGFRLALEASLPSWSPARSVSVLSNTTGDLHDGRADGLVDRLTRQISGTVRWVDNMHTVIRLKPHSILELGPGRPLRGFFRTIGHTVTSITNLTSARRALSDPNRTET